MFKSLEGYFIKKSKAFSKGDRNYKIVEEIVNRFLDQVLQSYDLPRSVKVEYNNGGQALTIVTSHKIVANELSMSLDKLYDEFRKQAVSLKKITVI